MDIRRLVWLPLMSAMGLVMARFVTAGIRLPAHPSNIPETWAGVLRLAVSRFRHPGLQHDG